MKFKLMALLGGLCIFAASFSALAVPDSLIRLATTTSTENSGLLGKLLPAFTADTGYRVHVIAVGTGKALRLGQDGDVDVVLVHALPAEKKFVAAGYGVKRYAVMHNDFVVLGPNNDPARVAQSATVAEVFKKIADTHAMFVSRGDNSGTNKKEKVIWKLAGVVPNGSWYREIGQGMGKAIQMSDELSAYTLSDRGTWLAFQDKVDLKIVFQGDPSLFNPYGIIAVNPRRYPDINYAGATALIKWITSSKGQQLIGAYRLHGKQLFTPDVH